MPERKISKLNKTTRLGGWYSKHGDLIVPESVQDVWFNIDVQFSSVDAHHDRLFETFVVTFGPVSREHVKLETSDLEWTLTTPFGNLKYTRDQLSSCSLAENSGNLVFTSRSARSKLYALPTRKQ